MGPTETSIHIYEFPVLYMFTGKGTQVWKKTGAIYEGDWECNMRHGFGTYNVLRDGVHAKQYAGGWKRDMRHVGCVECSRSSISKRSLGSMCALLYKPHLSHRGITVKSETSL